MSAQDQEFLKEAIREFYEKWKAQGGEYEYYEVAVGCLYGRGMARQQALLEARRLYPSLYKEFMFRMSNGMKNLLPQVFQSFQELHEQALSETRKTS